MNKQVKAGFGKGEIVFPPELFPLEGFIGVHDSPYARLMVLESHTCLICMVNGGMKYMPDRLAYERNTFEAQSSILLPGAAEHFVETVASALKELHGAK